MLFNDIAEHWGAYLSALVALSGLTMSLIQVGKELLFLRKHFHRAHVLKWLDPSIKRSALQDITIAPPLTQLEDDLLRIGAAGNQSALYDAELEEVCVQLSAATQMLVDYPSQAPALLKTIARGSTEHDLKLIIDASGSQPDDPHARQLVFDARNRVRAMTHRSVEMFKLVTAAEWRRRMQIASFVLSVLVALLALIMSGGLRDRPWAVLWTAVLAGFLAPVARDLLAAVQQLRR